MTDEELLKHIQSMEKMFGHLPNPEQEPDRFRYYVKIYKYFTEPQLPSYPPPPSA